MPPVHSETIPSIILLTLLLVQCQPAGEGEDMNRDIGGGPWCPAKRTLQSSFLLNFPSRSICASPWLHEVTITIHCSFETVTDAIGHNDLVKLK